MHLSVILLLTVISLSVYADVPDDQRAEVDYLIQFIRGTDCQLERNATFYSGAEAIEHILRKYEHYREEINSTEDFIAYSASKSMISGKAYIAHCKEHEPIEGRQWLMNQLSRYRGSAQTR